MTTRLVLVSVNVMSLPLAPQDYSFLEEYFHVQLTQPTSLVDDADVSLAIDELALRYGASAFSDAVLPSVADMASYHTSSAPAPAPAADVQRPASLTPLDFGADSDPYPPPRTERSTYTSGVVGGAAARASRSVGSDLHNGVGESSVGVLSRADASAVAGTSTDGFLARRTLDDVTNTVKYEMHGFMRGMEKQIQALRTETSDETARLNAVERTAKDALRGCTSTRQQFDTLYRSVYDKLAAMDTLSASMESVHRHSRDVDAALKEVRDSASGQVAQLAALRDHMAVSWCLSCFSCFSCFGYACRTCHARHGGMAVAMRECE
jgi:hypothetical protein